MRRSRSSRLFAALFAPWFAAALAEPVPMHDCPVHPSAVHAMARMPAPAVDRETSRVPHAGVEHAARADRHDTRGHGTHHQCCCLGACCASAPATLVGPPRLLQIFAQPRHEAAYSAAPSIARTVAEHVLPFANGPPAARV